MILRDQNIEQADEVKNKHCTPSFFFPSPAGIQELIATDCGMEGWGHTLNELIEKVCVVGYFKRRNERGEYVKSET